MVGAPGCSPVSTPLNPLLVSTVKVFLEQLSRVDTVGKLLLQVVTCLAVVGACKNQRFCDDLECLKVSFGDNLKAVVQSLPSIPDSVWRPMHLYGLEVREG